MVDFNNDTTVATPPGDVVKIVVLERREQCIEALEAYYGAMAGSVDTSHKVQILRARIMAFWFQVQAMVKRRQPDKYVELKKAFEKAVKSEDLISAYEWLNEFTDELGITFIDSRAKYDRTRVEDANSKKGL